MGVEDIILEKEGKVAVITLNRPNKLNAFSVGMREAMPKMIETIRQDDKIRAVILTGAGSGFCSGADVAVQAARIEGEAPVPASRLQIVAGAGGMVKPILSLEKPIIGAVNGIAAGAGFALALACDIRIASENARFSSIFVKRGLVPDSGLSYFLPRLVGTAKACQLMFTGDIIDAREAERLGIVSWIVTHQELMKSAKEFAVRIAQGPPIAIELTKRAIYKGIILDLDSMFDFETKGQMICRDTEDHKEGVRSFLEKRSPEFKGR